MTARAWCALAALLALCAAARAQSCTGGINRLECGAPYDKNSSPFLPKGKCASCSSCSCPAASCLSVVSACIASPGLVSYQVSFAGCKGTGNKGAAAYASAIDWVAFQGVNAEGKAFAIQSAMNPSQNLFTFDNTTACANIYSQNSTSTCCLQANVNGNGQINTFTVPCGTRPVVWMKDSTFNSCAKNANIPSYLTDYEGPNQCGGFGDSTSQLCGPYYLPPVSCNDLQSCDPSEKADKTTVVTINNNQWADYSATCVPGTICRYAGNACELDALWDAGCQCGTNPIRVGYCQYGWDSGSGYATCSCGTSDWGYDYAPILYPQPPWWGSWWCVTRVCGGWVDNCWTRPCRPVCGYWGCPGWGGAIPPVRPCRYKGCPGWPGDKPNPCRGKDCIDPGKPKPPIEGCRGRHCEQICPKGGGGSCPGFDQRPQTRPTPVKGDGFGRPTEPRPTPGDKPTTLPARPGGGDKPTTLPARPGGGGSEKPTTLPSGPGDGGPTTLPELPGGGGGGLTTLPSGPGEGGGVSLPGSGGGGVTTLPSLPGGGVTTLPAIPTTRPAPGGEGTGSFGRPTTLPAGPTTRPAVPETRPTTPTTRPAVPETRPTTPTTRPTTPTTRPATPAPRPATRPATSRAPPMPRPSASRPTTRPSGGGGGARGGGGGGHGRG